MVVETPDTGTDDLAQGNEQQGVTEEEVAEVENAPTAAELEAQRAVFEEFEGRVAETVVEIQSAEEDDIDYSAAVTLADEIRAADMSTEQKNELLGSIRGVIDDESLIPLVSEDGEGPAESRERSGPLTFEQIQEIFENPDALIRWVVNWLSEQYDKNLAPTLGPLDLDAVQDSIVSSIQGMQPGRRQRPSDGASESTETQTQTINGLNLQVQNNGSLADVLEAEDGNYRVDFLEGGVTFTSETGNQYAVYSQDVDYVNGMREVASGNPPSVQLNQIPVREGQELQVYARNQDGTWLDSSQLSAKVSDNATTTESSREISES